MYNTPWDFVYLGPIRHRVDTTPPKMREEKPTIRTPTSSWPPCNIISKTFLRSAFIIIARIISFFIIIIIIVSLQRNQDQIRWGDSNSGINAQLSKFVKKECFPLGFILPTVNLSTPLNEFFMGCIITTERTFMNGVLHSFLLLCNPLQLLPIFNAISLM